MKTEVLEKGPAEFNQLGQFKYYSLRESEGKISSKLAEALFKYGKERIKDIGLTSAVLNCEVIVGTLDGGQSSEDRAYYIDWKNKEGTTISLVGILISKGRPFLDHGLQIETT